MEGHQPANGCFLYVGAYTDAFPLTVPEFRKNHTHFIFVDKQPMHDDCMGARTEQELMVELATRASGALVHYWRDDASHCWRGTLLGGATFVYAFNTRDDEMRPHPALAPLLLDVTTLYVQGFTPHVSIVSALPRLRTVYATHLCRWTGAPLFYDAKGVPQARPDVKIVEVAESEWDQTDERWALSCFFERCFDVRRGRKYRITGAVLSSDCGPPPDVFIYDESDADEE